MKRIVLLATALLAACSGGGGDTTTPTPPAAPAVSNVTVSLGTLSVFPGGSTSASALLTSSTGAALTGRSIVWSSSATSVATIDQNGAITAVAAGTTSISATSEGRSGSAALTVALAPVSTVSLTLSQSTVVVGTPTTATVTLRDDRGAVLSGRTVTYSSSVTSVATVDGAGTVTTLSPGSAVITATSEGKSGVASLTVQPPPVATVSVTLSRALLTPNATTTATAVARDAQGNTLTGRAVTWSSSSPSVALVDGSGNISSIAPGTSSISATSEGKTGTATLTVQLPPVASVAIAGPQSLQPGQSAALIVTLKDANGTVLTDRAVTWTSSNPATAVVSSTGSVSGVAPGIATITAGSEGKSASVSMTVRYPIATVTIFGSSRTKVGDNYSYTVTARLADNSVIVRPITWAISEPNRATISAGGVLTPLQEGVYHIQAIIDGEIWESTHTAYDWLTLGSGGTTFATLEADTQITNKYGNSSYARLVVACDQTSGSFFTWVNLSGFITQNGLVALSFDGAAPFSQTWSELAPDYNTLWKAGSTGNIKTFATQIAAARTFGFAFTEYLGAAKAMIFRVTGLSSRLAPLFAACPSNAIMASTADAHALAAAMQSTTDVSSELRAARLRRAATGPVSAVAPSLPPFGALRAPESQAAKRRP